MEQDLVIGAGRSLAGIVLAAGESRRMGRPKLLLPLGDDTVLGHTLANALAGGVSPLIVVCGAYATEVAAQAEAKGLPCVFNAAYGAGQSSSLIAGLRAAPRDHGLMFILADQPFILPASYAALAAAYRHSQALIVAPQCPDGRRGNPVIIAPQLFAEINLLRGDTGARLVLEKYHSSILFVPLDDEGLLMDLDTEADYRLYGG